MFLFYNCLNSHLSDSTGLKFGESRRMYIFKSSKQITWFSLISLVDNLCRKSLRLSVILLCTLAMRILALV